MEINDFEIYNNKLHIDDRGSFIRFYDKSTNSRKLSIEQTNLSINPQKGTLRGMHFQTSGPPENKFMKLLSGEIFLAIVDLRKDEKTYLNVIQKTLRHEDQQTIFIPSGCATGWISLAKDSNIVYLMTSKYEECTYSGFKYNDAAVSIAWPMEPLVISNQDNTWPSLKIK
jgi:dTDP-4-dehydrorhamnose 3,5-epimerase